MWPITEELPISRHAAVDAAELLEEPRPLVGPELAPGRSGLLRSVDRLVAPRARVDQEQVGEVAERDRTPDAFGVGRVGSPGREPLPPGSERRGPPVGPRSVAFVAMLEEPSRQTLSANSWSSTIPITGCAWCIAIRSGSRW